MEYVPGWLHRNQQVQILGDEIELGVFKKLQVSTMFGRNQEQVGRSQAWKGQLVELGSSSEGGGAVVGVEQRREVI